MEVLSSGIPKSETAEVECTGNGSGFNGCGAKLEIDKGDIFIAGSGMDSTGDVPCIKCPECNATTIVDDIRNLTNAAWKQWRDSNL